MYATSVLTPDSLLRTMPLMEPPPFAIVKQPAGPPRSSWDLWWESQKGTPLDPGTHYIPGEGVVAAQVLYDRERSRNVRPLVLTLAQARRIKRDYWSGFKTARQIARERKLARETVARVIRGDTYWYA